MLVQLITLISLAFVSCQSLHGSVQEGPSDCNDILHVWNGDRCVSVCDHIDNEEPQFCNLSSSLKFDCSSYEYGVVAASAGYWYDNNVESYAVNCPVEYCQSYYENSSVSQPDRDQQCNQDWTGLVCGECNEPSFILFGTTVCVSENNCLLHGANGWLLIFSVLLIYWCVIMLTLTILFNFLLKFHIQIGFAYGLFFYYSVLEHVVTSTQNTHFYQLYLQNHCGSKPYQGFSNFLGTRSRLLISLASIGNLKPPFLQYMRLCLHTEVIDHIFFTYIHPLLVLSLMFITISISKRSYRNNRIHRIIQRHSSFLICLFLLLSYNSVSYTSIQLLRPLPLHQRHVAYTSVKWHTYWSPALEFAHGKHLGYLLVSVLCVVIFAFGFPIILLMQNVQPFAERINFDKIFGKPVLDQLQGCYKEKYRWFAAFYLLGRQAIYIAEMVTEFVSASADFFYTDRYLYKYLSLLMICIVIMVIHIWVQPYKERTLNMLDGAILLTLVFAIIANFTVSYFTQRLLWILPIVMFICYISHSTKTKFKHILTPLFCIVVFGYSLWCMIEIYINIISLIGLFASSYLLIKYIRRDCCQTFDSNTNEHDDIMEMILSRYDAFV